MSFAALKKSSYFDNLKNEIEKISNPQGQATLMIVFGRQKLTSLVMVML